MPRRNRRAPEEFVPATAPRSAAPEWANVAGFEVREVTGDKPYRCPGCDHEVKPRTAHVVVWPDGAGEYAADDRRHWHTACWTNRATRGPTRSWS